MGLDARHLRLHIVRPTLAYLNPAWRYSLAAENLLMGTAAHESGGFKWLVQRDGGPARGLWQIEPATLKDIIDRYLHKPKHVERFSHVMALTGTAPTREEQLVTNLAFACAIARVRYAMSPDPLPAVADDIESLARIWKRVYNTHIGAGSISEFRAAYETYCR
jgi:hypothetical protein